MAQYISSTSHYAVILGQPLSWLHVCQTGIVFGQGHLDIAVFILVQITNVPQLRQLCVKDMILFSFFFNLEKTVKDRRDGSSCGSPDFE